MWELGANERIKSRIQAAKMRCLRRIQEITRRNRVRNKVVRQELKFEPILKKIFKQQLKWFGHLMRMINSWPVKKVCQARMIAKRKRGRRSKTWENSIVDIVEDVFRSFIIHIIRICILCSLLVQTFGYRVISKYFYLI